MNNITWFNPRQPQTLQSAVIIFYIRAAMALLFGLLSMGFISIFHLAGVAAALGIANEKKWAYYLALVTAGIPALFDILGLINITSNDFSTSIITVLFDIVLIVLLVHPLSRDYKRIWFK